MKLVEKAVFLKKIQNLRGKLKHPVDDDDIFSQSYNYGYSDAIEDVFKILMDMKTEI